MSFIKVDTNTNPIPEGVLDPKNFSFPSGGGGGGGGGAVNFIVGGGSTSAIGSPLGGGDIPAGAVDFELLTLARTYLGDKTGWGLLTVGGVVIGPNPFPGFSPNLLGNLVIKVLFLTGKIGEITISADAIRAGCPFTLQHLFTTIDSTFPVKVTATNTLYWEKIDPPSPPEILNAGVSLNQMLLTVLEF